MRLQTLSILVLLSGLFTAGGAQAAEIRLRLSVQQSASGPIGQNVIGFKNEVETATGGAVMVDVTSGGHLVPSHEVPEAVSRGTIEMGVAPLTQYAAANLAASLFLQPFLFNFDAIVRVAAEPGSEIRRAVDTGILRQSGVRVLWWQPAGWNAIFSKEPVANPDEMAGRNVRVFGDVDAEFVKLCGGTPHIVPDARQREALENGEADSSIASISAVKDYELWRNAGTLTNVGYSENILMVIISEGAWQKLTPGQQKIVSDAARKAEKEIWDNHPATQAAIYAYATANGMKIQELTADDTVAWRICSSPILESFMERSGATGAKLLAAYAKLRSNPAVLAAKQ
jgi:C4-dicarboxylate-binding protein DctP